MELSDLFGTMAFMKLVLASGSEWRERLLAGLGLPYEVVVSGMEERVYEGEEPEEMVARLAVEKAMAVVTRLREGVFRTPSGSPLEKGRNLDEDERILVVGADTTVVCEGEMIGKPENREDARRIVNILQGKTHQVLTGVCVMDLDTMDKRVEVDSTDVVIMPMSEEQVEAYLNTDEWEGKAGGYQVQRAMAEYLADLQGSISNVIGLPLLVLEEMLESFGVLVEMDVRDAEDRMRKELVDEDDGSSLDAVNMR